MYSLYSFFLFVCPLKMIILLFQAEGLRLRSRGNPTSDAGSQLSSSHLGSSKDMHKAQFDDRLQEQPQSPMLYLAVILTIGLVGIFIGKFVV